MGLFAPTGILVDAKGDILNVQGRTGKYLETPSGPPTSNILDLAREGLRIELSTALRAAKDATKRITRRRLAVRTNGDVQTVDLHVCPLKTPKELEGRFLVVFEDVDVALAADPSGGGRTCGFALRILPNRRIGTRTPGPPGKAIRPPLKNWSLPTRNSRPPTRKFSPPMKNSSPPMRNWNPPRKNFSP